MTIRFKGGFYMDKSNNIIGSRILELRTRAGEKQEELAQAIHYLKR